jgi:ankyrin repeat protein
MQKAHNRNQYDQLVGLIQPASQSRSLKFKTEADKGAALALLKQLVPEHALTAESKALTLSEADYLALRKKQFQTVFGEAACYLYIKSLAANQRHFALEFLNSVIQCQGYQKDPLRPPSNARYKVTYRQVSDSQETKACIMLTDPEAKLTEEEQKIGVVAYHAMHTEEKKQRFSPKQSVSLLTKETYVDAFESNFGSAASVPQAGVILTQEDTLEGGYHGLYDSGTIGRPYRTHPLAKAREKLTTFQEKIYATPEKMAEALNQHTEAEGRYRAHTESLVRVRFTRENPGRIAIFKDDLASRWYALYLQALTAAQFKEQAEAADQEKEEKSITPPIYYYLPDSLKCFSDYTAAEQSADRKAAEEINKNQAFEKVRNKEFWFLLGLSKASLAARLNSTLKVEGVDMPVLSYLMLTGYVGLARGLAKLAGINTSEERYWAPFKPPVAVEEKESDSPHPLQTQADPQFIGQAALHFPTEYKGLDSRLLEAKYSNGDTALHTAVKLGFPKRVEALLPADKINFNARVNNNKTPLHWAAKRGHGDVVQELLNQQGILVNAEDNLGYTPLHWAAERGHLAVVNALLSHPNIQVNLRGNSRGDTPLHEAAKNGHREVIDALIQRVADVNLTNKWGYTPLHEAAKNGHREVIDALIQRVADVNAANNNGDTPLHWAAQLRHVDMVKLLLLAGADAAGIEINGQSILDWAAKNGHREVIDALIQGGADVNVKDNLGYTPLHWAAERGHLAVVKALLSHPNIQVNLRGNSRDDTPLHEAAKNGHLAVVNALLGADRIDVNLRNKWGHTPLHWAAKRGHGDVVQELLNQQGILVNAEDNLGYTPLHWAAERGHLAVVNALLSHPNIQVNLRGNYSATKNSDI